MKRTLLIAFLVGAGGSSRPPALEVTPVTEIPTRGGWYCQPGLTSGTWDCVQDPKLAENPPPPRPIPAPPAPAPRPAPGGPVAAAEMNPATHPFDALEPASAEAALPRDPPGDGSLEALPGGNYTIQLAAMFRRADLSPLLDRDDVGDGFVAEVESDGNIYHVLLLGLYDSEADARAAIDRLPDDLRALEPWVRRVSSLQRAQARAQRLAAADAP